MVLVQNRIIGKCLPRAELQWRNDSIVSCVFNTITVRVVGAAGCEGIHRGESMESKAFIHSPREERGTVCRDTPDWGVGAVNSYWIITGF